MTATKKPLTFDLERSPRPPVPATKEGQHDARVQIGARVTAATYRQLKARAAIRGEKVQELVEQAITEFLANHPQ